jgi:NTP pyrophosphatase (non-canonical NTP hydrolase)
MDSYIQEVLRTYAGDDTWEDKLTLGALGLAGEAGEVVDIVKKWRYQGHGFDASRFREEMGDVLWYLALMCSAFGWTLDDVMVVNIRKMREHYPNGFSSIHSRCRAVGEQESRAR